MGEFGTASSLQYATCNSCGKYCYLTRKAARLAAKRLHPGHHLQAYRCGEFWHLGHIARWKVNGQEEAVYGR